MSRLCHELVGAAGAIKNGVEFIEEDESDSIDSSAVELLSLSAEILNARLIFYRMAYGYAGNFITNLEELRKTALRYFEAEQGLEIDWPLAPCFVELDEGVARLVLCLLLVARSGLANGGVLEVEFDGEVFEVIASGKTSEIPESFMAALNGNLTIEELNAKNIHAYETVSLARRIEKMIEVNDDEDQVKYVVQI